MFWNNKDRDKDNQEINKDNNMVTQTKNKYYLEVIGGSNVNQLYVVNAYDVEIEGNSYTFVDEDGKLIACYPSVCTIIKSIEVSDK